MDGVLLIAPGLILLMGLAAVIWGLRERAWWGGFQQRAVRVPGQVTGIRTRRRSGRVGVHFSHSPQVAFALPDGTRMEAWARYPLPAAPARGSVLDVLVDPARPRRVIVADGPGAPTTALLIVGGFLILGGAIALAVFSALLG